MEPMEPMRVLPVYSYRPIVLNRFDLLHRLLQLLPRSRARWHRSFPPSRLSPPVPLALQLCHALREKHEKKIREGRRCEGRRRGGGRRGHRTRPRRQFYRASKPDERGVNRAKKEDAEVPFIGRERVCTDGSSGGYHERRVVERERLPTPLLEAASRYCAVSVLSIIGKRRKKREKPACQG